MGKRNPRTTRTISERIWNMNQSWNFERVFEINEGQRLRTTICRNAYDRQSFGKVERWNGEEWKLVATRSIKELGSEICEISYVVKGVRAQNFTGGVAILEGAALAIVS